MRNGTAYAAAQSCVQRPFPYRGRGLEAAVLALRKVSLVPYLIEFGRAVPNNTRHEPMRNSLDTKGPIRARPQSHGLLGPYSGHLQSRPLLSSASSRCRDCMRTAVLNRKAQTHWSVRLLPFISSSQLVMAESPQGPTLSRAYRNSYLGL